MSGDVFQGFIQASAPINLVATALGALLGLIVGMIPGLTISTGIIIVLPLTFVLDPAFSIALLLGLYVGGMMGGRSEEHTSELQSRRNLVCRLLLEKKKKELRAAV